MMRTHTKPDEFKNFYGMLVEMLKYSEVHSNDYGKDIYIEM